MPVSDGAVPDREAVAGARLERRWAVVSIVIVVAADRHGGLRRHPSGHHAANPVETADPRTLHLAGEFIESNLGSALEPDGSVIVRAIGQQYSFTPQCILVPTDTPITFRVTSADVVHGFLIDGHQHQHSCWCQATSPSIPARFSTPGEHGHAMPRILRHWP